MIIVVFAKLCGSFHFLIGYFQQTFVEKLINFLNFVPEMRSPKPILHIEVQQLRKERIPMMPQNKTRASLFRFGSIP